jgi:hypothetical protein
MATSQPGMAIQVDMVTALLVGILTLRRSIIKRTVAAAAAAAAQGVERRRFFAG